MYNSSAEEKLLSSAFQSSQIFKSFLKPDIDRREFIVSFLKGNGVPFIPVSLSTGNHLVVHYPKKTIIDAIEINCLLLTMIEKKALKGQMTTLLHVLF